ncbi:MAG: hypothetical protein ACPGVO_17055 [Spirulinaceae cyanobacterium]
MAVSKHRKQKQNFASFSKRQAFEALELDDLTPWQPKIDPLPPSDFFILRRQRLQQFDLESYEESKKLLIDAICEEAIQGFDQLKIWKGAAIESDQFTGHADYAIAPNRRYFALPLLCIIEAKKDDFEQGLAQCLVEMQACHGCNQQAGHTMPIFGIVTNGSTWYFYQRLTSGEVYESLPYAIGQLEMVLGFLRYIFAACQGNLA